MCMSIEGLQPIVFSLIACFQLHREMHTGIVTNERLWVEQLHPPPDPKPGDGDALILRVSAFLK